MPRRTMPRSLARAAVIAALYAAVTLLLRPISFDVVQFRVSEALAVLPFVAPAAVPGLFVGCLAANLIGGLGPYDVVLGSLATLAAAWLTRRMPAAYLAPLPPVLINGVVVGSYLGILTGVPVAYSIGYVALGEAVVCYLLGYPLLLALRKRPRLVELIRGD